LVLVEFEKEKLTAVKLSIAAGLKNYTVLKIINFLIARSGRALKIDIYLPRKREKKKTRKRI